MSSRLYPLYKAGNPQLRIFLPNFWMKVIRPTHDQPPNVVAFSCSMEMTRYDIKNYLEKIYNIPVKAVRTRIEMGPTRQMPNKGYVVKDDDLKYAYVTLPKEMEFKFPDIFSEEKQEEKKREEMKALDDQAENHKKYLEKHKTRKNLPSWWSL